MSIIDCILLQLIKVFNYTQHADYNYDNIQNRKSVTSVNILKKYLNRHFLSHLDYVHCIYLTNYFYSAFCNRSVK